MITVISSTNRKGSNSLFFSAYYAEILKKHSNEDVKLLDLSEIPMAWYENETFSADGQHPEFRKIQEEFIIPAQRFAFIIPEYNGSFPGVVKLFLDNCSLYMMKESFKIGTKKSLLAGISSGRAGNLRGMEHFTGILNYLNINVLANKLPISSVGAMLDENGKITDESTKKLIEAQVLDFLSK
jgi:chromate reductase, NAD(P)H dehydrogenase (quinone)